MWVKVMRQVSVTALRGDARETLKIAGLEKAKGRVLGQHLRLRAPQTWTAHCASVEQDLRNVGGLQCNSTHANAHYRCCVNVCLLWS